MEPEAADAGSTAVIMGAAGHAKREIRPVPRGKARQGKARHAKELASVRDDGRFANQSNFRDEMGLDGLCGIDLNSMI
ncbi:hypothetical protein TgHK011_000894 [Trichoderma gracile]|nr:hypothetical protein TgHK011_000894 [Trichoderma gracile]